MDYEGGQAPKKFWKLRKDYMGKTEQEWDDGLNKLIQNHAQFQSEGRDISVESKGGEVFVNVKNEPYMVVNPKDDTFATLSKESFENGQKILNNIIHTVTEPTLEDDTPKGKFESVLVDNSLRYL